MLEHWNSHTKIVKAEIGYDSLDRIYNNLNMIRDILSCQNIGLKYNSYKTILNESMTIVLFIEDKIETCICNHNLILEFEKHIETVIALTNDFYTARKDNKRKELVGAFNNVKTRLYNIKDNANYTLSELMAYVKLTTKNHVDIINKKIDNVAAKIYKLDFKHLINILANWVYIVRKLQENKYIDMKHIYEVDNEIYKKYMTYTTDDWIKKFEDLTKDWKNNFQTDIFFGSLSNLCTQMHEGISAGTIEECCFMKMSYFLLEIVQIYHGESPEVIEIKLDNTFKEKYDKLFNECDLNASVYSINSSDESDLSEKDSKSKNSQNIQKVPYYTVNQLSRIKYCESVIDSIPRGKLDVEELYRILSTNKIKDLEKFAVEQYESVFNDLPIEEEYETKRYNREYTDILKVLLDGDIDFIKENKQIKISNVPFTEFEYFVNLVTKDSQSIEYFEKLKRIIYYKKFGINYSTFDEMFEEHFILIFVRSAIADLYKTNIYDIPQEILDKISIERRLECTYELLSHFVFNSYIKEMLRLKRQLNKRQDQFKSFYQINDEDISKLIKRIDNDIEVTKKSKLCYNKRLLVYDNSLMSLYKLIISRIKKFIADIEG